jgi:hypothetical protein
MIYQKLLLSMTIMAFFLVSAEAVDSLSPSQLGESMSMPCLRSSFKKPEMRE